MVDRSRTRTGVALALLAGAGFAVQPVLVSYAVSAGGIASSVVTWRYVLAAPLLLALAGRRVLAVPRRVAVTVFVLGLVVYAADSALYYAALSRTSASLASLLHYAYLGIVVVAAALLGRERLTPRRGAALAAVLAGVALVGGAGDRLDMIGVGLALTAAASYAVYVLMSDHLLRQADPLALAGLLTAGAATSFLAWSTVHGQLTDVGGGVGAGVVLATTVTGAVAVASFLGGVRRVGPATASLLVAIEIPLTLGLAAVTLGDRLDPSQLLGAVFVLAGIAVLRLRLPRRRGGATLETG